MKPCEKRKRKLFAQGATLEAHTRMRTHIRLKEALHRRVGAWEVRKGGPLLIKYAHTKTLHTRHNGGVNA